MVNVEGEMRKLLRKFDAFCDIERATWYEWRQAAIEYARSDIQPLDLVLKAWEIVGHDTAKTYCNMLKKNSRTFIKDIGKCIVSSSTIMGEDAEVVEGKNSNEVFVRWNMCPWPEWARRYGVPMEEDVLGCDKWFQTIIGDINEFFGTNVKLETLKAIPRGNEYCLRRIWAEEE